MAVATAVMAASAAAPAKADLIGSLLTGNCPTNGQQVFAQWGDYASYFLAPNGGLELGSAGWSLNGGASVVSGNEPFLPTGTHSLALPSGSSAMSPVTCIGPKNIYVRMFGTDSEGSDSGLRVRVYWYGLLNKLLGFNDYTTFRSGSDWAPTSKLNSTSVPLLAVPILGSTSARIQFTPLGSGSDWQIDDVYVDPWLSR